MRLLFASLALISSLFLLASSSWLERKKTPPGEHRLSQSHNLKSGLDSPEGSTLAQGERLLLLAVNLFVVFVQEVLLLQL